MDTCIYYLYLGLLLCAGGAAARPTEPTWLWEPVSPSEGTCGHFRGNVSRPGYVSTPKYPHNYPDSLACELLIYVPEHHMVRLYFIDFALEASRDCWLDHLEVAQQDMYEQIHVLGKFCGRQMPPLLVGFGPALRLSFVSDRYVSSRGFRARLEFLPLL